MKKREEPRLKQKTPKHMSDGKADAGLKRAIARAEALLPGRYPRRMKRDPRWLAIIKVGEFIETHPIEVCNFALKWARVRNGDIGGAIHCCLIEHLLEHHFDLVFPMMRRAAFNNLWIADNFTPYSPYFQFGQAELPKNAARLKRLARQLERHHAERARRRKRRKSRAKKQKTAAS
jgi:hypothetical protein